MFSDIGCVNGLRRSHKLPAHSELKAAVGVNDPDLEVLDERFQAGDQLLPFLRAQDAGGVFSVLEQPAAEDLRRFSPQGIPGVGDAQGPICASPGASVWTT